MLHHFLPLLAESQEAEGEAVRLVLKSGETLICRKDELAAKLAETDAGKSLAQTLQIDFHRFGQKTTVAHLLHRPTNMAWVGISICAQNFNRKQGQETALRDAARQFLRFEAYRNAFSST